MEITVSGRAEASLPPERATLHLTASFESSDRVSVVAATTELAGRLDTDVAMLRAGDDGPVTSSSVQPIQTSSWVPWADGEPKAPRYRASVDLQVTFRDFRELSRFSTRWGEEQGVQLAHVDWALTGATREHWETELLERAVGRATSRARVIARAAGLTTVELLEVADPGMLGGSRGAGPEAGFAMAARAKFAEPSEGIDLRPADVVLSASVDARLRAT